MKLIIGNGSLSHTILLIANSVSIADDFITGPENADIFASACKYCFVNSLYTFQFALAHTLSHTHINIYNKWTISYINLHILCFAICIFSAARTDKY